MKSFLILIFASSLVVACSSPKSIVNPEEVVFQILSSRPEFASVRAETVGVLDSSITPWSATGRRSQVGLFGYVSSEKDQTLLIEALLRHGLEREVMFFVTVRDPMSMESTKLPNRVLGHDESIEYIKKFFSEE